MTDKSKEPLAAADVAAYLRRHPEFLGEHAELAQALVVPRSQGASTSLASYQLEVLREKNRELNRRLHELVAIAGENEQLVRRVHALTLSLMRARSLAETVARMAAALTEDFSTDLVRLVLRRADTELPAADWLLTLGPNEQLPLAFTDLAQGGAPLCGRLQPDKLNYLFGARVEAVRSSAVVGVGSAGLLAIGSSDANRFHPGMGTLFLTQIGESLAVALERFPIRS